MEIRGFVPNEAKYKEAKCVRWEIHTGGQNFENQTEDKRYQSQVG